MERGECLKKQMEILLELKTALKQPRNKEASAQDSNEDASISCTISCGIKIHFLSLSRIGATRVIPPLTFDDQFNEIHHLTN